jgi:hypothetical protein
LQHTYNLTEQAAFAGLSETALVSIAMYEPKSQKPISRHQFAKRLLVHLGAVFVLLLLSLGVGISGYMGFEKLSLTDAFENSAMLLGGMGQVINPTTEYGKLFAGGYALYAGLVFILACALIFTPIAHRILHKFHWDSPL